MKKRYLDLMEKALSAYSDEHIDRYLAQVRKNGFPDQACPRLASNIGILIANGRRVDLFARFLEMMDICCHQIPRVQAANDFSVREILACIETVSKAGLVEPARIEAWLKELATIEPYSCYTRIAKEPDEDQYNWVLFTALSEYRRNLAGLADTAEIIDVQIATHLALPFLALQPLYKNSLVLLGLMRSEIYCLTYDHHLPS